MATLRRQPPAPRGLILEPGQLMTVGECNRPPEDKGWLHEIKNDGWRLALLTDGEGGLRLQTRKGVDRTWDFQSPVRALADCGHALIIDGEVAVPDAIGVTRLASLHEAMREGSPERLTYFAFDLLHLDGKDLRSEPLQKRKGQLRLLFEALSRRLDLSRVLMVDGIIGRGQELFDRVGRLGCEGIVSKKLGSLYRGSDKPSTDWLKSVYERRV